VDQLEHADADAEELDDSADRDELRQRYYTLLQELRVVLPGVQVLLAFLLTVPFAQRFDELDDVGRAVFGTAMVSALLSVVCFLTPTIFHRVAERTARAARLEWGIRMTVLGMAFLGIALITSLWCVMRLIFGTATAWATTAPVVLAMVALWVALPLEYRRRPSEPDAG
jgi:MFS family permease